MEIFGKTRKEKIKVIELLGEYEDYRIIISTNEKYKDFADIYITNINYDYIMFVYSIKLNAVFDILDEENVKEWIEEYKSCYENEE